LSKRESAISRLPRRQSIASGALGGIAAFCQEKTVEGQSVRRADANPTGYRGDGFGNGVRVWPAILQAVCRYVVFGQFAAVG